MTELLSDIDTPSDAELISRVRGGDVAAYGELFARHKLAATRLARQLVRGPDADDLVSDAFAKVLTVLQGGGGPDVAFRAYLLTAVRRLHVDRVRAGSRLQTSDDMTQFDPGIPFQDTAVSGFESGAAAKAFASLPERWQLVLWHLEVEGQKPADIAPLLGMSANSVSALAYRAREGLRQAFLTMHLSDISAEQCRWVNEHLGAYVRNGLAKRDAAKVDAHLKECRRCTAMYLELTEVNSDLKAIIAPLLLGAAAAGYLTSTGSAGTAGALAVLGRLRDAVLANASVAATGAAAAGVAAVATTVVLVTHHGAATTVTSADRPIAATTQIGTPGASSDVSANAGPGVGSPVASSQPSSPVGSLALSPASPVGAPGSWTTPGALPSTVGNPVAPGGAPGTGPGSGLGTSTAPSTPAAPSAPASTPAGTPSTPQSPHSPSHPSTTPAPPQHSTPPPTHQPTPAEPGPSTPAPSSPEPSTPVPSTPVPSTPVPSSGGTNGGSPSGDPGNGNPGGNPGGGTSGDTTGGDPTGGDTGQPTPPPPDTGGGTGSDTGTGDKGAPTLSLAAGSATVTTPDEHGAFTVPVTISNLPPDVQQLTFTIAEDNPPTLMGVRAFTASSPVTFATAPLPTLEDAAGNSVGSCTTSGATATCTATRGVATATLPVALADPATTSVKITGTAKSEGQGDLAATPTTVTIEPPTADLALQSDSDLVTPDASGDYTVRAQVTGVPVGYLTDVTQNPQLSYSVEGDPAVTLATPVPQTTCTGPTDSSPTATATCTADLVLSAPDLGGESHVTIAVSGLPGYIDDRSNNSVPVDLQPGEATSNDWLVQVVRDSAVTGSTRTYTITVSGWQPDTTSLSFKVASDTESNGNDVVFIGAPDGCSKPDKNGSKELSCTIPAGNPSNYSGRFTLRLPSGQLGDARLTVSDGEPRPSIALSAAEDPEN